MKLRSFQSQQRPSGATVHKAVGRSEPIVVRDRARILENGSMTIMSEGASDRAEIDAILDVGNPMLLQFPLSADEPDRWIAHIDHERTRLIDSASKHERDETITWQQVSSPSGVGTTAVSDFVLIGTP